MDLWGIPLLTRIGLLLGVLRLPSGCHREGLPSDFESGCQLPIVAVETCSSGIFAARRSIQVESLPVDAPFAIAHRCCGRCCSRLSSGSLVVAGEDAPAATVRRIYKKGAAWFTAAIQLNFDLLPSIVKERLRVGADEEDA
ncbi:hypothetical protein ACLOJK_029637 [Asimina triloba]